jgi:ribose 5-phosphate isomerase B
MKIAIGSDHGGLELKNIVSQWLQENQYEVKDYGTYDAQSCDYPDIAVEVSKAVAAGEFERGILVCGTGIGMSIAANKVHGIRAALCHDAYSAKMSREHNDANILVLGQRVTGCGLALFIVETWLDTAFAGDRHQRRVDKLNKIEEDNI